MLFLSGGGGNERGMAKKTIKGGWGKWRPLPGSRSSAFLNLGAELSRRYYATEGGTGQSDKIFTRV